MLSLICITLVTLAVLVDALQGADQRPKWPEAELARGEIELFGTHKKLELLINKGVFIFQGAFHWPDDLGPLLGKINNAHVLELSRIGMENQRRGEGPNFSLQSLEL